MRSIRFVLAFIFILMASLGGVVSSADSATLEWVNPTTFADGTQFTPESLADAFLRIYEGDTENGPWRRAIHAPNGVDWEWIVYPKTSFTSDQFVEGKWYTLTFVVKIDLTQPMIDGNKIASDYATPVQYLVTPPPPPPTGGKKPTPPGQLKFR